MISQEDFNNLNSNSQNATGTEVANLLSKYRNTEELEQLENFELDDPFRTESAPPKNRRTITRDWVKNIPNRVAKPKPIPKMDRFWLTFFNEITGIRIHYFLNITEEDKTALESGTVDFKEIISKYMQILEGEEIEGFVTVNQKSLKTVKALVEKPDATGEGREVEERDAVMMKWEYDKYLDLLEDPHFDPVEFIQPFLNLDPLELVKNVEMPCKPQKHPAEKETLDEESESIFFPN